MSTVTDKVLSTAKLAWAKLWLKKPKGHYINGHWTAAEHELLESIDPATREVLGHIAKAGKVEVELAVQAARKALVKADWKRMPRRERAKALQHIAALIREHAAELATLECLDNGKLYREAYLDDMPEAADVFDYYAGWVDKFYSENCPVDDGYLNYTTRQPIGVCGLIVPWNFPLLLAMWKIAPALAMGNTVVVKPSPFTSFSLVRAVELINDAGILPPGVLNLVLGDGETGNLICEHQKAS